MFTATDIYKYVQYECINEQFWFLKPFWRRYHFACVSLKTIPMKLTVFGGHLERWHHDVWRETSIFSWVFTTDKVPHLGGNYRLLKLRNFWSMISMFQVGRSGKDSEEERKCKLMWGFIKRWQPSPVQDAAANITGPSCSHTDSTRRGLLK